MLACLIKKRTGGGLGGAWPRKGGIPL